MELPGEEEKSGNLSFSDRTEDTANSNNPATDFEVQSHYSHFSESELSYYGSENLSNIKWSHRMCPCLNKQRRTRKWYRGNNLNKLNEVEDTKYPLILAILEHPMLDIVSVISAVLSIFLVFFAEGFLIEGTILWGIIYSINAFYTLCVFCRWLEILLRSKFAKTNLHYSIKDLIFTFLSICPLDMFCLVYYAASGKVQNGIRNTNALWLTPIRMLYLFRIRTVFSFFAKLEDQLGIGDLGMFLGRAVLYTGTLIHFMACTWHRIHCEGLVGLHLHRRTDNVSSMHKSYSDCYHPDWIKGVAVPIDGPFRENSELHHNYIQHYSVSLYWATLMCFRLGTSPYYIYLSADSQIAFSSVVQLLSWIFLIIFVSGGLTSLFVEFDTQREKYLTRRFAIDKYLDFSDVSRRLRTEVNRFYDYLWMRSRGIHNWDMVKELPLTMKSEVYYDINKFIMDQLPIMSNLNEGFLMSLSVRMQHNFYLKGEVLHRRGDTGSGMFYVISGYLEVMSYDGTFVLAEIRRGSAIGELNLLQSYPCLTTVRCGTESDVMTLTKKDFKEVLSSYPENHPILLHRLETRLEQSGLLLALCEKHNEYPGAFAKLNDITLSDEKSKSDYMQSFGTINQLLDTTEFEAEKGWVDSNDFDDLNMSRETYERIRKMCQVTETPVQKPNSERELEAAACAALEVDVRRAVALAADLNIPRPPLTVTRPRNTSAIASSKAVRSRFSVCDRLVATITQMYEGRTVPYLLWKLTVTISTIFVFWYYTYQIAFADPNNFYLNYVWHFFDFIFCIDFIIDKCLVTVNTPQRPLETPLEITAYNLKTFDFWIRLITFLPIEYALGPLIGWSPQSEDTARLYHILKLNRILQYKEGLKFLVSFDGDARFSPVAISTMRFSLRLLYVIHVTACVMEVILKATNMHTENENISELTNSSKRHYEFVFYWAAEIVTGTGYGDIVLKSAWEFAITGIGLVVGCMTLMFLYARVSCIMVNAERRRVAFKQMYYSLRNFMKERRFPSWLILKVQAYYGVQWAAHEGTLISHERTAIWDAPKTLYDNICLAQAEKYVERIPLFKYCNRNLILEVCSALKQYILPPNQVIIYPSDRSRDLYIIVKGYCEVTYKGKPMGTLTEGRYIGLPGLIYGCNKPAQISTVTHCQLFCLDFEHFVRISNRYPKFLHEFKVLRGEASLKTRVLKAPSLEECEIPLPTVDEVGRFPPLFNAFEVDASDADSLAELTEKNTAIRESARAKSFMRTPYSSVISYFFIPVTILPSGKFLKWWTVFRVICALYIGNFVPIQVAFPITPMTTFITLVTFDVLAWIDMLVCFHIGFYGYGNLLVTKRKETVLHYLTGPFLLDFLGCFPFDYFVMLADPKITGFGEHHYFTMAYRKVALVRLNRMIQLYRIFVCGKLLQRTIAKSLSFLTLLQVVPLMFLFLNVMTCVSFASVCRPSGFNNDTLVTCDPNGWIMNGHLYSHNYDPETALKNTLLSYLISFYFVTESAFCVGFGDFNIIHNGDNRKLAVFLIISGAVISGYLVSKLTACLVGEDSRRIEIRDRTKILFRYLEQFKVPKDLRRRVKEACFAEWNKTKGIFPKDLFSALPPSLKCEALKRLYEVPLRQSPLFKDLDKPGMRMLSSKLTEMIYPEGEFVFKYGDLNDDVFFIAKGIVVTYTRNGDVIRYVGSGSLLGEISPLFDIQRMFTAVSGTDTELYVFHREDFLDFLSLYPAIRKTLEKICLIHYKQTIDATIRRNVEVRDTVIEAGGELREKDSNDTSKYRKSGLVIMKTTDSDALSKKSQILLEETVSDPLCLPAFAEEGENTWNSTSIGRKLRSSTSAPNPTCYERFNGWFCTFGRRPRDEMGLFHFVSEKNKITWKSAVIHPASPICNYVSFYLFLTSLSCGLTAYEIAFSTYEGQESIWLLIIRVFLEVFFIARILGNFRLAYFNENGELISNSFLVFKRYSLDPLGLWMDIISTFPFYIISHFSNESSYRQKAYIRGLQFFRMILFWSYLRETESDLRMNTSRVKIIKVSIILCFIFHFCACAWYLVACNGMKCGVNSWMSTVIKKEKINFPIGSRYLLSLYYVCSAITFTGLGDIEAKSGQELLLAIIMIFITVFVIGFLVGEMTQCLASQVAAKMHFRHRLRVMEHHFRSLGLSPSRIGEVKRYFMLLWMRCNGICYTDLLYHLPYSLRADLTMAVYGTNIKYSKMYGKLDKTIIRQLSAEVKHEIFMPGTHIVRSGDVCQAIYFIKKGEVVILDETPNAELCVEILYENDCFGEMKTILTGQPFRFSYVARLETEIGVLFHDDLIKVLKRHGHVYEDILEKARGIKARKASLGLEQESSTRPKSKKSRTKTQSTTLS